MHSKRQHRTINAWGTTNAQDALSRWMATWCTVSSSRVAAVISPPPPPLLGLSLAPVVFPWKLIKRRLIATIAVAVFWHVEFLMFVVFDAGAVLIAPSLPLSINATRFHGHRVLTHTRL